MDSDNQLLGVNFLYSDIDNGYDAFSMDNTRITLDKPGHDRQETFAGSIKYLKDFSKINLEVLLSLQIQTLNMAMMKIGVI